MQEEDETNPELLQNSSTPTSPDILSDEFFQSMKATKKINDKKKKLDKLIQSLKSNPSYLSSCSKDEKLTNLYNLLLSNLNENNNNYVSTQLTLIETMSQKLKGEKKFSDFTKKALPKLFDKFYLQNQKINYNLTKMFKGFIDHDILKIQDYFPHIENISLEEDDNYRSNIIKFISDEIHKDNNITYDKVSKPIVEIMKKLTTDEDEDISSMALNTLDDLDQRKNFKKKNKDIKDEENNKFESDENKGEDEDNIDSDNKNCKDKRPPKDPSPNEEEDFYNDDDYLEKDDYNKNKSNEKNIKNNKDIPRKDPTYSDNDDENDNNFRSGKKKNNLQNASGDNYSKLVNESEEKIKTNQKSFPPKDNSTLQKDEEEITSKEKDSVPPKDEIYSESKFSERTEEISSFPPKDNTKYDDEENEESNNKKLLSRTIKESSEEANMSSNNKSNSESQSQSQSLRKSIKDFSQSTKTSKENNDNSNSNNNNNDDKEKDKEKEKSMEQSKETKKSGGMKRTTIGGRFNKFRKQFGKSYKKPEEESQKVESSNIKPSQEAEGETISKFEIKNKDKEKEIDNLYEEKDKEKIEEHKEENKKDINLENNKDNERNQPEDKKEKIIEKDNNEKDKNERDNIEKDNNEKDNVKNNEKEKEKDNQIKYEGFDTETNNILNLENNNNDINDKKPKEEIKNNENPDLINNNNNNPFPNNQNYDPDDRPIRPKTNKDPSYFDIGDEEFMEMEKQAKQEVPKDLSPSPKKRKFVKEKKDKVEMETALNEIPIKDESPIINKEEKIININDNDYDNRVINNKTNDFGKQLELTLEKEKMLNQGGGENEENLNKPEEKDKIKIQKEDSRFDTIKSILGNEIVVCLFSTKWDEKKKGFELINSFIEENTSISYNITDLLDYIKLKLKNFKETNFNINREAINVFITMIKKRIIPKDYLINIIMVYYEKLTDIKLKDNISVFLITSLEIVEPNVLIKQIISKLTKKNNVKLLIEYSVFIGKVAEDFDIKELPIKEIIDFCKVMANNSNPQTRNAGTTLLCILYKYLGEDVKILIKDIKESTLKIILAELDKVTIVQQKDVNKKKKTIKTKNNNNDTENNDNNNKKRSHSGGGGGGCGLGIELIPPQDISKKITTQIIKDISDGKWPEKKEACEKIEKILSDANMRILPTGLNDLMNIIKNKLTDGNKNFVKMIISLLIKLIESLKQGFKQWSKQIALNLIPNLSDKNQVLRNECQICFDKWVEFVGFENLIIFFPQFLSTDNNESRTEIMSFVLKYKDKLKANKNVTDTFFKEVTNPLLICLQDKSVKVRAQAEEIIKLSLNNVPLKTYYKKIKDFKPVIANDLKQILDKIKSEINNNEENDNNNSKNNEDNKNNNNENDSHHKTNSININNLETNNKIMIDSSENNNNNVNSIYNQHNKNSKISFKKKNMVPSKSKVRFNEINNDNKEKEKTLKSYNTLSNFNKVNPNSNNNIKKDGTKSTTPKKTVQEIEKNKQKNNKNNNNIKTEKDSEENDTNNNSKISNTSQLGSKSTVLKKGKINSNINNNIPSMVFLPNAKVPQNKTKRYERDIKYKFSLDNANKDTFNKVKDLCRNLFTEEFSKKIFSDDFKKIVQGLKEMKQQLDNKEQIQIYFDNLDIILKVVGIKLNNNLNPTLLKNLFEFLSSLYNVIVENKYKLSEIETNILITLLIDKLSSVKLTLRDNLLSLINEYIELMDTNKTMLTVLNITLGKNSKIKTDILDLVTELYLNNKLTITTKSYVKIFCKFFSTNDNSVKNKTLPLFKEIYSLMGEEFLYMIDLNDKDKEFLKNTLGIGEENNHNNEVEQEEIEEEIEIDHTRYGSGFNSSADADDDVEDQQPPQPADSILNNNVQEGESEEKSSDNINKNNTNVNNHSYSSNSNIKKENPKMILYSEENQAESKGKEILERMNGLLSDDQVERVNTIILLHENLCAKYEENKPVLIPNIDKILHIFIKTTHKLFITPDLTAIPLKFAKYLSTVLCKLATNKELISNISFKMLYELCNELLSYLLITGLDKIGDNQEGNIIFKSINSTMLRIIDNCDNTSVILVLLELVKKHQQGEDKRLCSLAIKCLFKATDNLKDKINNIHFGKILLQIHLLLINYEKIYPDLKARTPIDTIIIRFIKNFINDVVKLKKNKILQDYSDSVENHQIKDKYILKWIKVGLDCIKNEEMNKNKSKNNSNNNNENNLENNEKNESKNKDEIEDDENKQNNNNGGGNSDINSNNNNNNTISQLKKKWNDLNKNKK